MTILMRYVLAWMGAAGIMNVYFSRSVKYSSLTTFTVFILRLRINLSTAIVAMVGVERRGVTRAGNISDVCPDRVTSDDISDISDNTVLRGEFAWDKRQQGLLLGSYYWSYTAAQIPAAWLAKRLGFRLVFGACMLVSGLLTALFPVMARAGLGLAITARVLIGLTHAVAFPAMTGAWGAWAPPLEITKSVSHVIMSRAHYVLFVVVRLQGIFWSGASIGTLIIFTLAGILADHLGWEAVFYVTGGLSLLWVVFWFLMVADTPAQHPRISPEERSYIEASLGQSASLDRRRLATPWRSILTSVPVWAIVLGHSASNWGNYTLNQQLPTYLSNVLRCTFIKNS